MKQAVHKRLNRLFALVLVFVMIAGMSLTVFAGETGAAESSLEIQPWPTWSNADEMNEWHGLTPENWNNSPLQGLYRVPATISGTPREFYLYVPSGAYNSQPVVNILVDSGDDVGTFLTDSGWIDIAEQNTVVLTVMVAREAAWGGYAAEFSYINNIYAFVRSSPMIGIRQQNQYLAAYGDAADLGVEFALKNPELFASLFAAGGEGMSAELITALNSNNTASPVLHDFDDNVLKLNKFVMPAFIVLDPGTVAEDRDRLVGHFTAANRTVATSEANSVDGKTGIHYAPDPTQFEQKDYVGLTDGGLYLHTGAWEGYVDSDVSEYVWDNLFKGIRRRTSWGEVHAFEFDDPRTESVRVMVNGYERWFDVFEPNSVKEAKAADPDAKFPVVFFFHGSNVAPADIIGASGWTQVAEDVKAIVLAPEGSVSWGSGISTHSATGIRYRSFGASWTTSVSTGAPIGRPNDLEFIDYLVEDWLVNQTNYSVDLSRLYASGQSLGGQFTHNVTRLRPYHFAASMPNSWLNQNPAGADLSVDIPIAIVVGSRDASGYYLSGSSGRQHFDHYIPRYNLTERGGLGRGYSDFDFRVTGNSVSPAATPVNVTRIQNVDGITLDRYEFETEKGVPMFQAITVLGMAHATTATPAYTLYQDTISHFSRDPVTKVLYYDGEVVDTPVNLALAAKAYPLSLTTKAHNVKAGDYFTMNATFIEKQSSNAATLCYTFDGDKFEYANFTPADGVQVVNTEYEKGSAKITLISMNYDLENFGDIMLRAKENAELAKEFQTVSLTADYVVKDEAGSKEILTAGASARFTTLGNGTIEPVEPGDTNDDGVVDLIDLSNMIDWFGTTSGDADWETLYTFFDFNNNGEIDINDISYVARLIK